MSCTRLRDRKFRLHRPPWPEVDVGAVLPVTVGEATWLYQCVSERVYWSVVLVLVRVLEDDCSPSQPPVALGTAESDELDEEAKGTGALPLPPRPSNAEVWAPFCQPKARLYDGLLLHSGQ